MSDTKSQVPHTKKPTFNRYESVGNLPHALADGAEDVRTKSRLISRRRLRLKCVRPKRLRRSWRFRGKSFHFVLNCNLMVHVEDDFS